MQLWTLVPHATLNPTEEQLAAYARLHPGGPKFPHRSAAEIFYASVTDLDTQIGRLLKRLDELGLADKTLILFSSDNGPEDIHIRNAGHSGVGSAGPFRGRKRSLYEGGVRVPFIVRWPGHVPAGRIDDTSVVAGCDFLPTLCKLAGAEIPQGPRPRRRRRQRHPAGPIAAAKEAADVELAVPHRRRGLSSQPDAGDPRRRL